MPIHQLLVIQGGVLNTGLDKCVDSTNTNYTSCDPQTEYYDDVRYNAALEYVLSPSNFFPTNRLHYGFFFHALIIAIHVSNIIHQITVIVTRISVLNIEETAHVLV